MSKSAVAAERMPVAIIGIGCRFPGGIVDPTTFWHALANGLDAITEIPPDRFDSHHYFDARPNTPGRSVTRLGGFVQQSLQEFDAEFFGIARTHAERLDPQQRLLLESSYEAMEDAGLDVEALRGSPTSVFVGQWTSDFEHRLYAKHDTIDFQMTLGSGRYATAARVSHAFGFRGESLSIDTGCSAGLAAVHLAVKSLRNGDSTMAIAAGVNVILQPHIHIAYSQSGMMAADGRCKFGDAAGDGYVRSEGCGVVVLKPLDAAVADGDRVYAIIRGTAMNNDGDTGLSLGSPSGRAHEDVMRAALRDADIAPARVGYVEAHGTGTRAGDPVEITAIANVLAEGRSATSRAWVGSVKTNLGHTESAAGLAGLIKGALMVQRGYVPPSLHVRTLNPAVAWDTLALAIPREMQPWPAEYHERVAGVSSLGIGGTNAHVVLSEFVSAERSNAVSASALTADAPLVLPLSARSAPALRALAERYADSLARCTFSDAMALCASAATRRTALSHRAALVQPDVLSLAAALRAFASGAPATAAGVVHERAPRAVAFVVPGQGGQWMGMARELLASSAIFRDTFVSCDVAARPYLRVSLLEQLQLERSDAMYAGDRIDVIQPTLVALSISYAAWLRSGGVSPSAVVGHSMGEIGAAAIAGALSIHDAMKIVCLRSALMQRVAGHGAMAVLELPVADTEARISAYNGRVSVAAINSARSTVISGDTDIVRNIHGALEAEGIFCRMVQVEVAAHSAQMTPLASELATALAGVHPQESRVPMTSTVTGTRTPGSDLDAAYWATNMRAPVQFSRAISAVLSDGIELFVEVGPHGVLTTAIEQNARAAGLDVLAVACGRREHPDVMTAYEAVTSLWCAGASVDWLQLMPDAAPWTTNGVQLPRYPWQRERFWLPAADIAVDGAQYATQLAPDEKLLATLHTYSWERVPLVPEKRDESTSTPHWIVVDGAHTAANIIADALRARGAAADAVASIEEAAATLQRVASRTTALGVVTHVLVLPVEDANIAFSPVATMNTVQHALAGSSLSPAPRLWWVTNGAQAVAGCAMSAACAERAAAWGAARVMAAEHPQWVGGVIDLDVETAGADQTRALVEHLLSPSDEELVALRAGERYALRITPLHPASVAPFRWRKDATYLLTGGFGGIGLHLATSMVQQGVRRIILLGRTPLPVRAEWPSLDPASPTGRRAAAVRTLESMGCAVHLMCVDVADEREVRAAVTSFGAEGWPPIGGVVHMAAELDNRLSPEMTRSVFDHVLSAKLSGAEVLDRVFPELDLFVLTSSVSASVTQPGMANYTAANAGCDALAASRRQRGQHALSIQWAAWEDVGMHQHDRAALDVHALARLGVSSITVEQAQSLFPIMLSQRASVITVLPLQPDVFRANATAARRRLFQNAFEVVRDAADSTSIATDTIRNMLPSASPVERRHQLALLVTETLSSILRRPAGEIGGRRTFGSMGVDSLMGLALRNRLEVALERPLAATLAWNYPTVDALTAHLETFFESKGTAAAAPAARVLRSDAFDDAIEMDNAMFGHDLSTLIDTVGEMSDADTARLLRGAQSDT